MIPRNRSVALWFRLALFFFRRHTFFTNFNITWGFHGSDNSSRVGSGKENPVRPAIFETS